ncbi:MAG: hypothetical protein KME12_24305 [Trichocoleus desertorum ATA4-8-CV12]|nr:hypothetical protein [Trichocoleus desertorum ATA4-8-CV12]
MANPSLGGTRPQTPAEGRLRPPDPLQKGLFFYGELGKSILGGKLWLAAFI